MKNKRTKSYQEQYAYIRGLIDQGRIRPMKSAKSNGKNPALPTSFWIVEEKKDYSILEEELRFGLDPRIVPDYYLKHLPQYARDRAAVQALSQYLRERSDELLVEVSENERSYAIWHREKFLQRGPGLRILKNCGLEPSVLEYYQTSEPLAYYTATRTPGQNILIIENKDTFFSMRRALLQEQPAICGAEIGTLIYGAGKGIWKSLDDFEICVEPYMTDRRNTYLYFGDMDYEGIGIYEKVAEKFAQAGREIRPFVAAYRMMMEKALAGDLSTLPETSENQVKSNGDRFFSAFDPDLQRLMRQVLEAGRYVPQEILHIGDFHVVIAEEA